MLYISLHAVFKSLKECENALYFPTCSIPSSIGVLVIHLKKIILSEMDLSLLLNLLKPTSYVTHQQFNIQQL